MKTKARKAAIAAYKERKVVGGVYVVRCEATGESWVGGAPDLSTIWRRLSFTLGQGICPHSSLQAAWRAHGRDSFSFEELERVDEELDYVRDRVLKQRREHWCTVLGGRAI